MSGRAPVRSKDRKRLYYLQHHLYIEGTSKAMTPTANFRKGIFLFFIAGVLYLASSLQAASANLFDDFNRSDSSAIGNGWIEKSTGNFAISNLSVVKQTVSTGYRDNVVYRPDTEDLLDAEASIELRLNTDPPGYPQVFVRLQSTTVDQPDTLDGYILYINDSTTEAILGRQSGNSFVEALASITISPALNTTDTFRMRLSATGASPVSLSATIERFNGSGWDIIGEAGLTDNSATQITTPGSVGFGGYIENSYSYDNFRRTDLGSSGQNNPQPVIAALNPSSQTAGSSDFLLTVTGSGFVVDSVVRWGGSDRVTNFVSDTELQATITSTDLATAGTVDITVFNPEPGGGLSGSTVFTIEEITPNPVPVLSEITPDTVTAGSNDFLLTVTGSNFIPESVLRWNGSDRATTYLSDTQLQATIPASDVMNAGTADITVFNPAPGGGASATYTLTITESQTSNPLPVLASMNPQQADQGSSGFTLIITGTDFVPGAIVQWNGSDRTTAFISSSELQATILDSDLQSSGIVSVTAINPAPGGGVSNSLDFIVNEIVQNPVPVLLNLTPQSAEVNTTNLTLNVTGTDFVQSTVIRWNGTDLPTTFISGTQLQAAIPDSELQTAGTAVVTVFTPAPGGGESGTLAFSIDNSTSITNFSIETLTPDFVYAGESGVLLNVTGNNFDSNSTVRWNGSDRPTTFLSDTELQANISATDVANAGTASVTVYSQGEGTTEPLTFIILDPLSNYFSDTFNRSDSETIGNNWTEKLDEAYSIQNGQIVGVDTQNINGESYVFHDTIVYRPEIEDIQDVEVSIEFVRQQTDGQEFPQLHARVQRDSVEINGTLESYILYVDDTREEPTLTFAIVQPNYNELECNIGEYTMPSPLIGGERYRMRFQVSGTYPVTLSGYLDRFNGQSWEIFTQATMQHDDNTQPSTYYCYPGYVPPPIMNAGTIGFAKWSTDTQVYDNFYWVDLNATSGSSGNPQPVLQSVAPTSVVAGDPSFTLTVTGTDFSLNSIVRWDGADRSTTFVSSTELQAAIPASDVTTAGNVNITVFTPAPGGGESGPVQFTINDPASTDNPVPATTQISPSSVLAGSGDFTLSVSGSGFVPDSVIRWNGTGVTTQYVSDTRLDATILSSSISAAGTVSIDVSNPAPGGGISNAQQLTIIQPGSVFSDDFERTDSSVLGNGWLEKDPAAFFLVNGQAAKQVNSSSYVDNIVYRPAVEDILDMETSLEFNLREAQPGYPQIFARVQSDSVAFSGILDAYMLYVNDSADQAILGRQTGNNFVTSLANINISPPLTTTDVYRLRLSVTGTNPVVVTGYIERQNGAVWDIIGQGSFSDTSAERIQDPGSAGFGGYIEGSYNFDNFTRLDLSQ